MRAHIHSLSSAGVCRIAVIVLLGLTALQPSRLLAQTNCEEGAGPLAKTNPTGTTPEEIIRKFSANETAFKQALTNYTYVMDISVQTLEGDTNTGEFRQVSDIHWDHGTLKEVVTFAPQSSLRSISLSKEDFDDIYRSQFVLTTADLPQYTVLYAGQQRVDQLDTYVFDVAPKQMEKGIRYFQGRIWVDKIDMVLIKACGKSVPDAIPQPRAKKKKKKRGDVEENISPTVVTFRELIDGKYWFPTYMRSDEILHFPTNDVHVKEVIKFKQFKAPGND